MDKQLDFFQVDAAYISYLLKYDSRVPKVDYSAVSAHEKFLCGIGKCMVMITSHLYLHLGRHSERI